MIQKQIIRNVTSLIPMIPRLSVVWLVGPSICPYLLKRRKSYNSMLLSEHLFFYMINTFLLKVENSPAKSPTIPKRSSLVNIFSDLKRKLHVFMFYIPHKKGNYMLTK